MEQIRLITDLAPWRKVIDKALLHDIDGHTILEVVERVKSGEFLAVDMAGRAVMIVNILEGENRVLNVVLVAGSAMPHWLRLSIQFLKALAKDQHCSVVRVQGRQGWVKMLRPFGFYKKATILEAVL